MSASDYDGDYSNVPAHWAEAFIVAEYSPQLDIAPSDWVQHKSDRDPEGLDL